MHRSSTVTARVGKRASDVIETTKLVHAEPTTHEKDCAGSVGRGAAAQRSWWWWGGGGGGGAEGRAGEVQQVVWACSSSVRTCTSVARRLTRTRIRRSGR